MDIKTLLALFKLSQTKPLLDRNSLYFITCGDLVKIGKSTNPQQRLAQIQTSAPGPCVMTACFKSAGYLEAEIHRLLREQRRHGEWFVYDEHVKHLIESIANGEIA